MAKLREGETPNLLISGSIPAHSKTLSRFFVFSYFALFLAFQSYCLRLSRFVAYFFASSDFCLFSIR